MAGYAASTTRACRSRSWQRGGTSPYAAEVPGLAPLPEAADGLAEAQASVIRATPRVWLVEPAVTIIRDRRLRLPGGVFGDFATASVASEPDKAAL